MNHGLTTPYSPQGCSNLRSRVPEREIGIGWGGEHLMTCRKQREQGQNSTSPIKGYSLNNLALQLKETYGSSMKVEGRQRLLLRYECVRKVGFIFVDI